MEKKFLMASRSFIQTHPSTNTYTSSAWRWKKKAFIFIKREGNLWILSSLRSSK